MARLLTTAILCVCVGTVATQAVAVAVLAAHGRLTASSWEQIVAALDPSAAPAPQAAAPPEAPAGEPRLPTYEEVLERRALAALQLQDRTEQLRSAARAVFAEADRVDAARAAVAAARAGFAAELARAREELQDEATERSRGLLTKMQPRAAVAYLMTVPDAAAVRLLSGLDGRTGAKLFGQFGKGTDAERAKGAALFAALDRGDPLAGVIDGAAAAAAGTNPPPDPAAAAVQ